VAIRKDSGRAAALLKMTSSAPVAIVIADDHPLYRDALATLIEREAGFRLAGTATSFDETLEALQAGPVDAAVIDLHMPGMAGGASIARLRAEAPDVRLVVVSGDAEPATVRAVMAAGAHGFVPKTFAPGSLIAAIRLVLSGVTYLPAELAAPVAAEPVTGATALTQRELEVLTQLARGSSHKEIARALDLAEVTVKLHTRRIVSKLKAKNRSAAIAQAIRDGIVRLD
jgi:two-component system, NarL family, nitrate/nitrite response regulator NarL